MKTSVGFAALKDKLVTKESVLVNSFVGDLIMWAVTSIYISWLRFFYSNLNIVAQ